MKSCLVINFAQLRCLELFQIALKIGKNPLRKCRLEYYFYGIDIDSLLISWMQKLLMFLPTAYLKLLDDPFKYRKASKYCATDKLQKEQGQLSN